MGKTLSQIRLFLFTCTGEDNYILKRCNVSIQLKFASIGLFVILIFIGCFFSAAFFMDELFENLKWISIPVGILWGSMVTNMYLLLLNTISPSIIPLASKKKKSQNEDPNSFKQKTAFMNASMLLRLSFMALLAIIIAQPLNVSLFKRFVNHEINEYKTIEKIKLYTNSNTHLIKEENKRCQSIVLQEKLKSLRLAGNDTLCFRLIVDKIKMDSIFLNTTIKKLNQLKKIDRKYFLSINEEQNHRLLIKDLDVLLDNELNSDKAFIALMNDSKNNTDFEVYKRDLASLIQSKINNYTKLDLLLNSSNFYVKTIQLLLHNCLWSLLLSFIIVFIFLTPIFLKFYLRNSTAKEFFLENHNPKIVRLRKELLETTDFKWLESTLKNTSLTEIKTSDYYFVRMFIEHKLILEEYNETKQQFSRILSDRVASFNINAIRYLYPLLNKLKPINKDRYKTLKNKIENEFKNELIVKYEYWIDMPFRSKRHKKIVVQNTEEELLDFLYNKNQSE
ncbi:DUF4407 domain-containing protein [Flavobacterium stagni]|uniref:DUF4407 domain-containing protein n=1 Tax=Flavobacterium stagni TaxID=2506421 RepID=A0A4Q1K8H3_9FLAO|nr:DUF4407 domain-containing protein [Flavobacterium stagni]RXR21623.1 DUF4407 domain-containing protein [Flavobacterium stagni]